MSTSPLARFLRTATWPQRWLGRFAILLVVYLLAFAVVGVVRIIRVPASSFAWPFVLVSAFLAAALHAIVVRPGHRIWDSGEGRFTGSGRRPQGPGDDSRADDR